MNESLETLDFNDFGLNLDAVTDDNKNAKKVFCENWESTKPVIMAIIAMIKNPVIKGTIILLIKVLDNLYENKCPV